MTVLSNFDTISDSFLGSFLSLLTFHHKGYGLILKSVILGSIALLFPSSNVTLNLTVSLLLSPYYRSLISVIFGIIFNLRFSGSFSPGELVLLSQLTSQLLLSCNQLKGWPSFFFLLNIFPIMISPLLPKKSFNLIPVGSWIVLSASLTLNNLIINELLFCIWNNLNLVLYWIFVVTLTVSVPLIVSFSNQNSLRKFYHFAAVSLFIPAAFLSLFLLKIALAVASTLFIYIETLRHDYSKSSKSIFITALNQFIGRCRNELDRGDMVLSHLYLLLGCALPFWLDDHKELNLACFSGVISLGIGDSLASIAGKRFGRHQWHRRTRKTLEGSAAGCLGMFLSWILLNELMLTKTAWPELLAISIGSSLWEALIHLNDNLTLPLFTFTLCKYINKSNTL